LVERLAWNLDHDRVYKKYGQVLWTEGQKKIDGVYFIISGEFEVTQD
jgi:hypothetical protein